MWWGRYRTDVPCERLTGAGQIAVTGWRATRKRERQQSSGENMLTTSVHDLCGMMSEGHEKWAGALVDKRQGKAEQGREAGMSYMTCALNAHSGRLMRQSCWLVGRGRSNQHNHAPAPLHGLVVAREREAKETGKGCLCEGDGDERCAVFCCCWYNVDWNLQRPTRLDSTRVSWWWCCFARLARRQKETVSADRNVGPACTSITSATLHVPRSIPTVVGELSLEEATLKSCSGLESRVVEHQLRERG
jgi:hypothetical protein